MGFESPSISWVVHAKPARHMVDFVQQVGMSTRKFSVLFFNANDISMNMEGMPNNMREYCKTIACPRKRFSVLLWNRCPRNDPPHTHTHTHTQWECCWNCNLNCVCSVCSCRFNIVFGQSMNKRGMLSLLPNTTQCKSPSFARSLRCIIRNTYMQKNGLYGS